MQSNEKIFITFLESLNVSQEENTLLTSAFKCLDSVFDNARILIGRMIDDENIIVEKAFSTNDKAVLKTIISNFTPSQKSYELSIHENISTKQDIQSCVAFFLDKNRKDAFLICFKSPNIKIDKEKLEFTNKVLLHLSSAINRLQNIEHVCSSIESIKEQNSNLRESNFKISSYMNNMTHEFKNPIAAILGFTDLLISKQKLDPEGIGYAQNISDASNRIKALVDDFLDLSKIESEGESFIYESFNFEDLIKDSIDNFKKINKFADIDLDYKLSSNVSSSPKHLRRVVDNLISNSIKYSPDEPKVKVSVEKSGNNIKLTVIDNGIGIEECNLPKVFERFYRVKDKKVENICGTGLGLSICKEVADHLGGKINVKSTLGKGTTVTFSFPAS